MAAEPNQGDVLAAAASTAAVMLDGGMAANPLQVLAQSVTSRRKRPP